MRPRDTLKGELIGLEIEIVNARNRSLVGLQGTIVDETRNTLTIMQENKEKKLIKDQITFTTSINNQKITINGEDLVGRSEERLKKKTK
jgi:ribonuclease P protein subunit POP4